MSDDGLNSTVDRRRFLTVLGVAGGSAAVLSGCAPKAEKLIPYLVQSEDQVPGIPTYYASTCTECAAGCGVHVKTREGRAIKLEGNPDHPVNQGKLCARGQASLQGLYNPGRIKAPMVRDGSGWKEITWDDAIGRLVAALQKGGAPLAVLSGGPRGTFDDLLADWTTTAGGSLTRWEPLDHVALREANKLTFGRDELPAHDFAAARYIVSFGADFLETWLSPTENQIGYSASHGFTGDAARHVHVAARRDLTGLNADEWLGAAPGSEAAVALAMAGVVAGMRGGAGAHAALLAGWTPDKAAKVSGIPADVITRVAREFAGATPSLAVAGGASAQHRGAVELCAAVNVLNAVAGNIGRTVKFGANLPTGDGFAGIRTLAAAMEAGQVGVLFVHEANPLYALPATVKFADHLKKVPFKVSTGPFLDETAAQCDLLLPNLHALERWGDVRPRAGVYGLLQPVMEPVFNGRHTGDVLLDASRKMGGAFGKFTAPTFEAHLRSAWSSRAPDDAAWRAALARGGVYEEAAPASVLPTGATFDAAIPSFDGDGDFVFMAYPHPFLHDGRGANRPWLLENPDPVTKITWHPWIEISLATARRLDIKRGEIIRLVSPHGEIAGPAYPYAGLHDGVVAAPLGFGHTEYGQFAKDRGFNALDLLGDPGATLDFVPYVSTRVRLEKTHDYKDVATTEGNPRQLGRGIAEAIPLAYAKRGMTVKEALRAEGHGEHAVNTPAEVDAIMGWRERDVEGRKLGNYAEVHPSWGLTVDLSRCTGCSACVTACYAENNIPTVGEDQVLRGREMSWMRIERYWEGGEDDGEPFEARFVPMLCQQCENAPCEPVCPVFAAYHTVDGLNGQVYNRCVGTRYCSNNCPYKVRYFNWYKYNEKAWPEPLNLQLNPDVTVRARGVMEKCTFCIQRIRGAQHQARLENREIKDGEFTTACAQACPSSAIVFGNRRDPESRVAQVSRDPRGYHVLEDLNVRPAITYLAKVLNRAEA